MVAQRSLSEKHIQFPLNWRFLDFCYRHICRNFNLSGFRKISLLCTTKHRFYNEISEPIIKYEGRNVTKIWFSCSNYQFVWNLNDEKVCVKVKRMFPGIGLAPEPKSRYFTPWKQQWILYSNHYNDILKLDRYFYVLNTEIHHKVFMYVYLQIKNQWKQRKPSGFEITLYGCTKRITNQISICFPKFRTGDDDNGVHSYHNLVFRLVFTGFSSKISDP